MKKRLLTALLLGMAAFGLVACGKKEEPAEVATTEEVTTQEETTEDIHAGLHYNELTGVWSADYKEKRPIAVMINNIREALPSSDTKKADIIYECKVEGGITRLLALFSDYDNIEKLGSIRSARHYYINLANEHDAIYVHFGQSKPAKERLDNHEIDNINGLTYDAGFYRDNARVAPHNVYTTSERILKGIEDMGYSTEYPEDHKPVFAFNEEDTDMENGQDANTVHVNFSSYQKPYFVYNPETKLYDRYEYGNPQIDSMADPEDNVLQFKNIIVEITEYSCINPKNDLQNCTLTGNGTGYYITNGKAIPIKWSKESRYTTTIFTTEDGEELHLNPGKTWVSIIGNTEDCGVAFE